MQETQDDDWMLAGRAEELRAIDSATSQGKGVLMEGQLGMGMSQLLGAALRRAEAKGLTVVSVGGTGGAGASASAAFDTLDTCLERLARMRRPQGALPPVLGVDDVHLLNSPTAARLCALASSGRASIVAAATRGACPPVGIDMLWLEHHVERVDLAPFDRPTVARVVRARLGVEVGASTLERLWATTRGHPLLLRELMEQSLTDGSFCRVGGVWRWRGLTGAPPKRLADAALFRLRDLTSDEHELACMLAIAESVETDLVLQAGLGAAAESLYARGLVAEERAGRRIRLRLSEPLTGHVLASRISAFTGRRLRRQVADALTATGARREDDVLRIVALRMDAGLVPERDHLLAAALTAIRRGSHQFAERVCRTALSRSDDETAEPARARMLLARVLSSTGRHAEAEAEFAAAAKTPVQLPREEYVDAFRARVDNLVWGMRRTAEAVALADEAMQSLDGPSARALEGCRAALALHADRLADILAIADRVLPLESPGSPTVRAILPVAAFARLERGDPVGALELLRLHGGRLEDWEDDALCHRDAVVTRCLFHLGGQEASASMLEEMERSTDLQDRARQFHTSVTRACLYRKGGRLREAAELLREVGTVPRRHDWLDTHCIVGWLAGVLAEMGEHSEALCTLLEADSEESDKPDCPIVRDSMAQERALVLAYAGDVSGAVGQAMEVAKRASEAGRTLTAVAALHLAARVADAGPLTCQARGLADGSTSELVHLQADHIAALAAADGDALRTVADRFRANGALPLAAEALAQAARAHHSAGQLRKGQAAWTACQEILTTTEGMLPPWAAREAPDERPAATLTTREREVAALVASGLTNRGIAARLVVSVRTVENHLHRVYNKLGISARTDVGRALADQGGDRASA
ncbi:LuxR C-terminal-related transcriptional regulator [Streptomyces asiaticus]|uniref:helix-turn-helix transcriptional regulator n=1 Tax=Streptomyces asiaticus TaxID=114695 RepID=UPI003F6732E0